LSRCCGTRFQPAKEIADRPEHRAEIDRQQTGLVLEHDILSSDEAGGDAPDRLALEAD